VPADRIYESLAFINWTVLTALGTGTFGAVVVGRFRTEATKGYLAFTAFSAAAFAFLAVLADTGLATFQPHVAVPLDPAWDAPRRASLAALAIVAVLYGLRLRAGHRTPILAAAGVVAGALALLFAAAGWGGGGLASVPLLIQLVFLATALGGVWAAMVLGHWYLVTPRLPEAPLVRLSRWLAIALAVQLGLFVAWLALGAGPSGTPAFAALVGPWALFVWLRLLVGLVFPLIVSWAAVQTARTRSMESATGLLYINVGTIAAGTILAAGLYFGAGLLV
jgi:hypothetical protein